MQNKGSAAVDDIKEGQRANCMYEWSFELKAVATTAGIYCQVLCNWALEPSYWLQDLDRYKRACETVVFTSPLNLLLHVDMITVNPSWQPKLHGKSSKQLSSYKCKMP